MPRAVQFSSELRRVLSLPRRTWTDADAARFADELTALFAVRSVGHDGPDSGHDLCRACGAPLRLRPVQGIALLELAQCGGLFAPIRVGGGKTLITALAGTVTESDRVLLMIPANLTEKTKRELDAMRFHWVMPELLRTMSYETLGHPKSGPELDKDGRVITPDALDRFMADLIVLDECHRAKRPSAAVTKRIRRHHKTRRKAGKPVKLAAMTGTPITHTLMDCGPLLGSALGQGAPVPLAGSQLEEWSHALDKDDVDVGALTALGGTKEDKDSVRRAFRDRLTQTPGVIIFDRPFRGVGLAVDPLPLDPPMVVKDALEVLRDKWELPDGSQLVEALELWRYLFQMAIGLWYRWHPAPPREWLEARSEWFTTVRHLVGANRRNLDSPKPVVEAIDKGLYPEATDVLARWRAVKDAYDPKRNRQAVWLHPFAAEAAASWLEEEGICWTAHTAFAERVAELAGVPYFASEGRDKHGLHIMDASGPVVASVQSCGQGNNLQGIWNRNLVTSIRGAAVMEQLIGRTHREGQTRDVSVEWFRTCDEHDQAFDKAINKARFVESTTGLQQKLVI